MKQPVPPPVIFRDVFITCFTCNKDIKVQLKSWQLDKKITCPLCRGKEAIIGFKIFNSL